MCVRALVVVRSVRSPVSGPLRARESLDEVDRGKPRAPSDDEVDELARHDDRLAYLFAVQLSLDAGRGLRPLDQLGLGQLGRDLEAVTNLAVDLNHQLEGVVLEQGLVGDGPRLLPHSLLAEPLPELLRA